MNKKERNRLYEKLVEGWDESYKERPLYKEIQKILHPERSLKEDMKKAFQKAKDNGHPFFKDWNEKKFKKLPKDFYNSPEWANKRIEILKRDNFKCIHCGAPANHVDHINSAYYFPEMALDSNNLISSCEACHKKRQPKGKWK